jgi:hypothetical protein
MLFSSINLIMLRTLKSLVYFNPLASITNESGSREVKKITVPDFEYWN